MNVLSKQAGFTLLEFTIVMIVLSILAAVIVAQWPGSTISLNAQAEALASDLRYTQNLSMTKGVRYQLVKLSPNSYRISNITGTVLMPIETFGSGITFSSMTNLPNNLIAFDGKGVPYSDASTPGTPLSLTASMTLASGSVTKSVLITPETGRVSL